MWLLTPRGTSGVRAAFFKGYWNPRRLPVEKDDTDTLAAIRAGLEQGCGLFSIYGGTGGKRLDHTLANLQSLLFLRRRGVIHELSAPRNHTFVISLFYL